MEIIRISDSKLKVSLDTEDMTRYDLSTEQMNYNTTETRRVLWQILDEAKHTTGFNAADDRILIQAYPGRKGGCEIYVTKLAAKQDGTPLRGKESLYACPSLDMLFTICQKLHRGGHLYESALFEGAQAGTHFLLIREKPQNSIMRSGKLTPLSFLEEYTDRLPYTALGEIKEHGHCLIAENAIETLAAFAVEM